MKISKVRVLTTLKCGPRVWRKGIIVSSPIPDDILSEVRYVTGTVEVLEGSGYLTEPPEEQPRTFTADVSSKRKKTVAKPKSKPEVRRSLLKPRKRK